MKHAIRTIIIIILFVVLFVCLFALIKSIISIVTGKLNERKINQFFTVHRTKDGEYIECMKQKGKTYTTMEFQGKYSPSKPKLHVIASQYYVRVKCTSGDLQYIAIYQIRPYDYNVLSRDTLVGSMIQIRDTWQPYAYKII